MTIPRLKRIKVSSEQELRNWLSRNSGHKSEIMVVTCSRKSSDKFVSRDQLEDALTGHGWSSGQRYTLKGNLVGQVASRA